MKKVTSIVIGTIILSHPVFASSVKESLEELNNEGKKWNVTVTFDHTTSLHRESNYKKIAQSSIIINPIFNLKNNLRLSLKTSLSKDHVGYQDTNLSNTSLSLKFPNKSLNKNNTLLTSIISTLPTSESAYRDTSFRGSLGISNVLINSSINKVTGLYFLSLKKNFHKYQTTNLFTENSEYLLSSGSLLSTAINGDINISVSGFYNLGWSYTKSLKTSFSISEELTYTIDKNSYISLGHSNSGNALRANGTDNNIEVFNSDSSIFYSSYSKKF